MWDPEVYLAFDDHRGRPFYDLLARVPATNPRGVVDIGCGPGNLTADLPRRWPDARITGFDSSAEMVAAAVERGVDAQVADVRDWAPEPGTDVLVCNAVLQWVPGHEDLLERWVRALDSSAWIAFQVPGNFDAPSHRAIRELAAEQPWRTRLSGLGLRGVDTVAEPARYAELLLEAGCEVDVWETTYQQRLRGADPVLDWVRGTALRPIVEALDEQESAEFRAQLAPRLRAAYPALRDGSTLFAFRRIFAVARVG
ncbi:trans-aconitate 2-methyltransferase [Sciscionella marina]|uniref:trans-aconitate 2-methyltransferase n=1 Tax=Sciscionella marina TaxID=508770 RepID=UPI00037BE35B|nr:trans-aconitate 2-methyltransferase [Sciscionella marina]